MAQTINFDRWIMYGSGWEVSFVAQLENLTVTRAYGSDYATVSGKAWIKSVGGSTNTKAKFWIQLNSSAWTEVNIAGSNGSGGWYTYWAGDWYSQTFSFNVAVGATAGSISGQVCFSVYDINGPSADSAYKTYAQSYGSKGASTITSATNVTLSTSGTVNSSVSWTAYSNTFTYDLSASLGGYTASATYSNLSGDVTKTLGFGTNFIKAITSSKSASCTITLTTKSGSTVIGTSTKNITLTVPSGINPSVTIATEKASALSSTYFSGKFCTLIDKMKVTLSTSTQYSATVSSRAISANGESFTASPATTSALKSYGVNTVVASVTDSRGNSSGTVTKTVNVYWYFYPTVTAKYRHATNYLLDISGRIAYVGGDQTTKTLRLAIYKGTTLIQNNINLDSYIATNASGGTYDGYLNISGEYTIPDEYIADIATDTYEFRLTVSDTVSSSTSSAYSGIAVMTFGAGGTDVTILKPLYMAYGSAITSGDNINDISTTAVGEHWCNNAQNKPSGSGQWGRLVTNQCVQTYYEYDTMSTSPYRVYSRMFANGNWTTWQMIADRAYQYWIYKGKLIQGIGASVAGYGTATISCTNGLYRIDFMAKITTADSSQYWDWGIDRDFLTATIGKTIRFVTGGNWIGINSSSGVVTGGLDYGTCVYPRYSNRFAGFGRMYQTDGSDGLWASNHFAVGTILQGVAYATL